MLLTRLPVCSFSNAAGLGHARHPSLWNNSDFLFYATAIPASKPSGMLNRQTRCRAHLALALILLLVVPPQPARAYSVLSHEQVVDLSWKSHIIPLLQRRYPGITPEQIKEAHAYAYGGAIIQDLGYYPFGSKLLSDMTHYVRLRRLRLQPHPRCAKSGRIRLRPRRARPLQLGHPRPPRRQSSHGQRISQAPPPLRP